ncbi:sigma-54-dependent Fis family transcriptional regulator [Ectothiorhodospiraceae bacterium 2226]|nr:sigma-54-dependent Fis family transcriptional regulator [Ectothiorhodospiraceae bacterium 2226]
MSDTPKQARALVVDDEPDICELLSITLARMGISVDTRENLARARLALARQRYDLCLTDMRLPDGNGIDLVRDIQQQWPDLPVAVITAHGNMECAVEALKAGAFDFVSKPVELHVLRNLIQSALRLPRERGGAAAPKPERPELRLLGDSPAMARTRATIGKLARSQAPVYISGESGSGKELVARLIHAGGPRADKPFIPVNCGAIPEHLMESEFFGHRKGSFTGATADKEGLFQAANGGTLFLDEVADLPLHMQVKLLRAIQEKAVRPLGASREAPVDVRILSATHQNLAERVREGQFREDLFYRINVIELRVPSLRERREDLPVLVEHILHQLAQENGVTAPRLTQEAMDALRAYAFPGNVRELENILERAMTLCDGARITPDDLNLPETDDDDAPEAGLDPFLESLQKDAILRALEETRYNKTAAAKRLGITFRALRYRLKKLGLEA